MSSQAMWRLSQVLALLVCLLGCAWAGLARQSCDACDRATDLFGGLNLALPGVVVYFGLLILAVVAYARRTIEPSAPESIVPRIVKTGIAAAAGVHIVLLFLLFRNRISCIPCVTTGISAVAGMGAVVAETARTWPATVASCLVAALASFGASKAMRPPAAFWEHRSATRAASRVIAEGGAPAAGRARLVAYLRRGCHRCEEFERMLPGVQRRYGLGLSVEIRPASNDMNTPTVVVLGRQNTLFDGILTLNDLQLAVEQAVGSTSPTIPVRTAVPINAVPEGKTMNERP